MKVFAPSEPVCIISPHLDDAVLSCGYFLHQHPGTHVLTVLAGSPDKFITDQTNWNTRTTGEFYVPDAMKKRKKEDTTALGFLGAKAIYLDGWDLPYLEGQERDEEPLFKMVLSALTKNEFKSLVLPVGFHHPDHISVGNICRKLIGKIEADYYFYLELPYGVAFWSEAQKRLEEVAKLGKLEEMAPVSAIKGLKDEAFRFYKSQYQPIRKEFEKSGEYDKALSEPERYWKLS